MATVQVPGTTSPAVSCVDAGDRASPAPNGRKRGQVPGPKTAQSLVPPPLGEWSPSPSIGFGVGLRDSEEERVLRARDLLLCDVDRYSGVVKPADGG